MITIVLLASVLAALVLSGFFSGAETGIYSLNRVRLSVASERNRPGARRLAALMRTPEDLVITTLLGTNVADYLITASIATLLLRMAVSPERTEVYATAIATPLVLVFGGIIPKDWFRRESDRLMYTLSLPVSVCVRLARAIGVVWTARGLAHRLTRWLDPLHAGRREDLLPRAGTLRLLREGAAGGRLTVLQRDLMNRVMQISTTRVSGVMIARERCATVAGTIPRDDFLRIARMAHFSRLPVHAGDPRRIVGIVNVYDVLTDPERGSVETHMRPPFRLPADTSVSAALLRMQQARQAMAIVEDRSGNCIGILTIKDLAEEIIGDFEAW